MFRGVSHLVVILAGALAAAALAGCGNTPGRQEPAASGPQSSPAAAAPGVFIGASVFGVPLDSGGTGGRIEFLLPGGPAEAAGLREGDIITVFGSTPVSTNTELVAALKDVAPGTAVPVTAVRGGQPITVEVRPEARPTDFNGRFKQAITARIETEEQAATEAATQRAYRRAFDHDVKAVQLIGIAQHELLNAAQRFDADLTQIAVLLPKLKPAPSISAAAQNYSDHAIAILRQAHSDTDNDAAAQSFGLAIHETPWIADLYRNYGLVLAKAGNADGANANLNRYLILDPNAPDAAATKQRIAELQPLADEQKAWRPFLGSHEMENNEVDALTLRNRNLLVTVATAAPSGGYKSGDTLCWGTISGNQFRGRCAFKSDHPGFIGCFGGKRDYDADGGIDTSGTLIIRSVKYVHYDPGSCAVDTEDRGAFRTYTPPRQGP